MKKIVVVLVSFLLIMSFAFTKANANDELRTYYNQNVPYEAFFGQSQAQKIKVQKTVNGKTVQAVVPAHIVNTKENDKTQEQEKKDN